MKSACPSHIASISSWVRKTDFQGQAKVDERGCAVARTPIDTGNVSNVSAIPLMRWIYLGYAYTTPAQPFYTPAELQADNELMLLICIL